MIRIDLTNTFLPIEVSEDLSSMIFISPLKNGENIEIKISIKDLYYELLPNVYNLSFGPIDENGEINDVVKVSHLDINKVFSTILLFTLTFLQNNPSKMIGIDGSNDIRAYLYHRMFLTNYHYLQNYFITIGVDWYVRLLRNGEVEKDQDDNPFFKPKPESFDYHRNTQDLYRYYMFHLNTKS